MITKKRTPRSLKAGTIMFASFESTRATAIIIENDKENQHCKLYAMNYDDKGNCTNEWTNSYNYRQMKSIIKQCHIIV